MTSGQFAKMAKVSVRTVRYYDKQNILKASYVNPKNGARYYTDEDLVKLQQILLYKYLGFSLDEIKELMVNCDDKNFIMDSMKLQQTLIADKIEQMELVKKAVDDTLSIYENDQNIDWDRMLKLIHLTGMESSLNKQYQNANNVSARINLHRLYSQNKQGWFSWIYDNLNLKPGMRILEVGCGNGELWRENIEKLPKQLNIVLSDISSGMLNDAKKNISLALSNMKKPVDIDSIFEFSEFNCLDIPFDDNYFDIVIANHTLFYCDKPQLAVGEIKRVLKNNGDMYASTYGCNHMKEITLLVKEFDERIELAAIELYHSFGLDNGYDILAEQFKNVEKKLYEDCLIVDKAEPLLEYIMSCHGNQNQYIIDRYKEFKSYVEKKVSVTKGFKISKDAGIFIAYNKN